MASPFSYYNSLPFDSMKDGVGGVIHQNVQFLDNQSPKIPAVRLSEDFDERLRNIKNWWNLDRSEAARRTYIDAFVYEAMAKSKSPSLIVTAEEYVANNAAWLGYGYFDYLLSAIDRDSGRPIYTPSIVIEAKAYIPGNPLYGQNQLLAEMVTLWQIKGTDITRGVLTDGRFWKFYELNMTTGFLPASIFYDTETGEEHLTAVVGLLNKFFNMYQSSTSALIKI